MVKSPVQDGRFTFESYGFRVSLESDDADLLSKAVETARTALIGNLTIIENSLSEAGYLFSFRRKGDVMHLFQNGEEMNYSESEYLFFKLFNALLRIVVAENAVNTVFVHAGVVGFKNRAVVFPGRSFKGKTTLVAELIKIGADYYSDEYALIGDDGLVRPFPRDLSLRSYVVEYDEVDVSPESLGAKIGVDPLEAGALIITEFADDAVWEPQPLTVGEGILECIPHTIPINADPEMSLKLLNLAFRNAIIAKSYRGDVKRDAVQILTFLDKHLN